MVVYLYIHGFGSSGRGAKVSMLRERLGEAVVAPSLSPIPDLAIDTLEQIVSLMVRCGIRPGLIGSSLGGYYATWLAERYDLKAVLINPSVTPWRTLVSQIGDNSSFYDLSRYEWTQKHIDSLQNYAVESITPERYMLLLQSGDEVLDYRKAVQKFAGAAIDLEEGGSHGYEGFERKISAITSFLASPVASARQ